MKVTVLLALCLVACGEGAPQPPNILFIVADDMGYGDLTCYGGEQVVALAASTIGLPAAVASWSWVGDETKKTKRIEDAYLYAAP